VDRELLRRAAQRPPVDSYPRHASRTGRAAKVLLVVAMVALGLSSVHAQDAPVPKKYQPLYAELERQLGAFEAQIPPPLADTTPLRAATLASAPCELPPALTAESRRQAIQLELDGLQRAGVELVVLDICYPLLSASFHDPRLVLEHYANLANEVRIRNLRLLVRHRTLAPTHGAMVASRYYSRVGKHRMLASRYDELKSIVLAVQPDYLTLIASPREDSAGLKLTPADWRRYLQRSITGLRDELGDLTPALGAGAELWDDVKLVDTFAGVAGLDYIDLRAHAPISTTGTPLTRLLSWPERIRTIDPGKRILVTDAWLYKSAPAEAFQGRLQPGILARDAYSFWAPLDIRFLQDMMRVARAARIEAVSVAQPSYLFAYLDFFDPTAFRANPRLVMELVARKAEQAVRDETLSPTGRAFGTL